MEDQMKKTLKTEHPPRREALRLYRYEDLAESPRLQKAISEEMVSLEKNQTCSLVRILAGKKASQILWMFMVKEEQNSSKRYKARLVVKGFQQKQRLAEQKENLECRLKEIMYILIQALRLSLIHLVKNLKVGDEREVKVLRSFSWPLSELITKDGVLLERVQRVPYVRRYRKVRAVALFNERKVRAVALLKGRWIKVYRDYLRWRAVK
ncbi:hypothetical protein Tco_1165785 [Tanacetum coccineum]